MTNQQQHGVEIVYRKKKKKTKKQKKKKKKGISNNQTYISNNCNHKATTT